MEKTGQNIHEKMQFQCHNEKKKKKDNNDNKRNKGIMI